MFKSSINLFMKKLFKGIFSVVALCTVLLCIIEACDNGGDTTPPSVGNNQLGNLPEEIRLNSYGLTLIVGGKETLTATVLPARATNKKVKWSSGNPKVAAVDPANGTVTAISVGITVITATTEAGGKTANCAVSVTEVQVPGPGPIEISLFPPTLTMNIGDTDTLIVTGMPSNASKNVIWRSDNPGVVVVEHSKARNCTD